MVNYEGIFFEGENLEKILSLEKTKLSNSNLLVHCTFKYSPKENEIDNNLVGKEFDVFLTGYACDGRNSGFSLRLSDDIWKYYINREFKTGKLRIPHITTSIAEGEKPLHTKDLKFEKFEKPIKVKGRFGFFIIDEDKQYLSYEKYDISKMGDKK